MGTLQTLWWKIKAALGFKVSRQREGVELTPYEYELLFGKWDLYNRHREARSLGGISRVAVRFRWEADGKPCPECIHEEGRFADFVFGRDEDVATRAWRQYYMTLYTFDTPASREWLCDRHKEERLTEIRERFESIRRATEKDESL